MPANAKIFTVNRDQYLDCIDPDDEIKIDSLDRESYVKLDDTVYMAAGSKKIPVVVKCISSNILTCQCQQGFNHLCEAVCLVKHQEGYVVIVRSLTDLSVKTKQGFTY